MARFGLSPYGNPVEAGIDAFAKVTGVFQGIDRAKMEKEAHGVEMEDKSQRRKLIDVEMEEKTQDLAMKKQKFTEEVEKAGKQREENQREAEVVDNIPKGLKPSEMQNQYYTLMRKAGTTKTPKELKEAAAVLFKVDKLTGHIVPDDNSETGFSFLTEEQGLVPGAPDPDSRVNKQIAAQGERQDKEIRAIGARQDKTIAAQSALVDKKEAVKAKKDDSEKKAEKIKKQITTELYKDPAWKDLPSDEVDNEIDRRVELKLAGKKVTKAPSNPKAELRDWMTGLGSDNDYSGIEDAIRGAVDAGHQKSDLREAAGSVINKEEKKQILAAIDKAKTSKEEHPGTKIQPRSAGKAAPSKDKWMEAARAKNKGVADKDLEAFYNKKYGSK